MAADTPEHPRPLVLLASSEELSAEPLERSLSAERFRVIRTSTTAALFERGAALEPDAVIVEIDPPDATTATNTCRALVQQPWTDLTTPVLVTCARPLTAEARIRLLRAGAWDILQRPVNLRELMVRLHHYLAAKRHSSRARLAALIDPETGLYNFRGLRRRCEEMAADAFRRHAALACLAIRTAPTDPGVLTNAELRTTAARVQELLRKARRSDVIGRHGPVEFLVIAPRTDAQGVLGLARRLWRDVETVAAEHGAPRIPLQLGYDAVANMHEGPTEPTTLLTGAIEAARRVRPEPNVLPIQPFRPFEHRAPDWTD